MFGPLFVCFALAALLTHTTSVFPIQYNTGTSRLSWPLPLPPPPRLPPLPPPQRSPRVIMAFKDWAFPVGVLAVLWGALHLAVRRAYPMPPPGNRAVVVVSGMLDCVM